MKIGVNEIRVGYVIEHKSRKWFITKTEHVKPGKGGAFMQVELKDLATGTKSNERFRSSDTVERVHMEEKDYQYLYTDGDEYVFMDQETFEQLSLQPELIGQSVHFLEENMIVRVLLCDGEPIGITLPETIIMEIIEAEPTVKGQTASASFKPAKLKNGQRVMVPQYIESGTRVVVRTEDCSYVERAKV
jgi:elongation factor P